MKHKLVETTCNIKAMTSPTQVWVKKTNKIPTRRAFVHDLLFGNDSRLDLQANLCNRENIGNYGEGNMEISASFEGCDNKKNK